MTYQTSKYLHIYLSFFVLIGLVSCSSDDTDVTENINTVKVENHIVVALQEVPMRYVTSGTVTSDHSVSISSRLSGYIRDMKVREGDQVKAGQILLTIDSVNAKQALIQAKADLNNAKSDMQRYKSLLKAGAVTSRQADKVMLRYQVAKSQVAQAKHQLSYANVLSPVSGVVVQKRMSQGDLASPGVPLLTIEDPSSLLVQTYVSEQFVGRIYEGDSVDVEMASLKKHFQGVIRQVVQAADPVSHQFLVKTALPPTEDIHPGMYAQTGFYIGMRKTVLLPRAALLSQAGLHGVYIVDSEGITHYRQVRLGKEYGDKVEILAGLHAKDVVIWSGKQLSSGMKVIL